MDILPYVLVVRDMRQISICELLLKLYIYFIKKMFCTIFEQIAIAYLNCRKLNSLPYFTLLKYYLKY